MKLLIQNYSNSCSSQPMYLNECLSRVGLDSKLWNLNEPTSVYDKLDSEKPDLVLTSFQTMHQDLIAYISQNKQVKLVVDITGIDQNILNNLEVMVKNQDIDCPFFVSQDYKFLSNLKTDKKIVNLLPCYDIFAIATPTPDYNIEAAVVSNKVCDKFTEACSMYKTYHKIIMADNPDLNFDLQANVLNMDSLYEKYEEVVVVGDVNFTCSQVFFDGFVKAKKLTVRVPEEQKELFNQVLATLFYEEEDTPNIDNIKQQIKKHHSCFNRAAKLALELGEEEASKTLLESVKQL